jgi:hypothetical protein
MDIVQVMDGIRKGDLSPDGFAGLIPKMLKMRYRFLPEVLAYVVTERLWERWGFRNPDQYFDAIGVPSNITQQTCMVLLEVAADARGQTMPQSMKDGIRRLAESSPSAMSSREFMLRLKELEVAASSGSSSSGVAA